MASAHMWPSASSMCDESRSRSRCTTQNGGIEDEDADGIGWDGVGTRKFTLSVSPVRPICWESLRELMKGSDSVLPKISDPCIAECMPRQ